MPELTRLCGTLLLLGGLLMGLGSCRSSPKQVAPAPAVQGSGVERPRPSPIAASPEADAYALAIDQADSALTISQSAQTQDDWSLVISRWQQAVQLMKSVPSNSPRHTQSRTKLAEFERNLSTARKQANRLGSSPSIDPGAAIDGSSRSYILVPNSSPSPAAPQDSSANEAGVYRARIKRRAAETPVIDVTFNGTQTFEMIVDTGASATVITEPMATALGAQVVGKTKVDTASETNVEVPLVNVDSISVGGASVKRVTVAVGQSLELGLLGHDFFKDFDVTIKRDVVEFRSRN